MKQTINIGTAANDGTGDALRTAMDKVNDNFNEVYGYRDIGATAAQVPTTAELEAVFGTAVSNGVGWSCIVKYTNLGNPFYGKIYSTGLIYLYVNLRIL